MLDYNTLNALVEKKLANGEIENTIIPNPTLVGDEENLNGVEIKGVKYKVGGSGVHLYKHNVRLQGGNYLEIYNASSVPLTISSLKQDYQGEYNGYRLTVAMEGSQLEIPYLVIITITESAVKSTYYALKVTGTTLNSNYSYTNNSVTSLTDTVTQIF